MHRDGDGLAKSSAAVLVAAASCLSVILAAASGGDRFTFILLGDRTGGAQPGVYEQIWQETAAEHPAFVISCGDSIEGQQDESAAGQWEEVERVWTKYRRVPLYLAPGNHDIWSEASEKLFRQHAGHPPRYSFDYGEAHFTILDNSRSDEFSAEDLDFLGKDLKAHAGAAVKLIVSHRPSWILGAALNNPAFPLHRMARQYGVRYVIAGHIHQMLRFQLEGITYLSMPSSGGHLRLSEKYEDGWFYGHARADVNGRDVGMQIEEVKPPRGRGRITRDSDWGAAGLLDRAKAAAQAAR